MDKTTRDDARGAAMRSAAVLLLVLTIVVAGCGSKTAAPVQDPAGQFSYCPPAGWTQQTRANLTHGICVGPKQDGIEPNLVFATEESSLDLAAYADQYVAIAGTAPTREPFTTQDGSAGFRWRLAQTLAGQSLRQTQYVFGEGARKCLVTCTGPANGGEAFDRVFDESMKTFRFAR